MALLTDRTLASGVTLNDLIHIVITGDTSQNPAGSSYKAKVEQVAVAIGTAAFSGGTVIYPTTFANGLSANTFYATTYLNLPGSSNGNCLSDFHVSNIHSCSPLYINPLDEGNVVFGSSNQVYIDLSNNRIGLNNIPSYNIDAIGSGGGRFIFRDSTLSGNIALLKSSSATTNNIMSAGSNGLQITVFGDDSGASYGSVTSGDTLILTNSSSNKLVFNTQSGAARQKNIEFFAGKTPDTKPDLTIVGTGTTRGYVGVNKPNPQSQLDVDGKTTTTNFQMTSGSSQGYVLVDLDGSGNGQWTKTNQLQAKNWGSFLSTVDQTISVAGTTYKMSADTGSSSGVTLSANTRFVVSTPGVYNIQFSAQLIKDTPATTAAFIWLSKNGNPVSNSNTEVVLPGNNGERLVASWNWVDEATTANTYYEIEWTASVNNLRMDYVVSPAYGPSIPSLIVTITQV